MITFNVVVVKSHPVQKTLVPGAASAASESHLVLAFEMKITGWIETCVKDAC